MSKLSNRYQKCKMLNLGYGPQGRGPFVIRQDGHVPDSITLREERFLLRKDGTWVLNLAVFAMPEKDREQFLYDTSAEVLELLSRLTGEPVIEADLPPGKSVEELRAAAENTITGLWGRIRQAKASKLTP